MNQQTHSRLVAFIWRIADDCLRDVYVRGKYRDVILPMVVLRRLDTLLEDSKEKVLKEVRFQKEQMKTHDPDEDALKHASGHVFYNISPWTLKKLFDTATNNQQILLANIEEYLNGFSANVKEIIKCFKLLDQMRHMAEKQVLLDVIEKFVSPRINLTPYDRTDPDGNTLPGLSNLGMGYVFEELIRRFNEENNEEAGEHFTPREVIHLMTHLVFDPIRDQLPPVVTIYDPACGSGGMLTESQNYIKDPAHGIAASSDVYLFGKEINDETYAICKSDMMIKGNSPENIRVGSTLSTDEFENQRFDFMLSNPPYGKSWSSEVKNIKDGKDVIDPRFQVQLADYWGNIETVDATPRTSDGQLLFLMEMVSKMKPLDASPLGSRIASVHNGSSLFTGDAGSGESNIRRHLIENDLLDAIIQLPNNLFYNTGITTYIWLLSNNKPASRRGKVMLIDANPLYRKLRKNLGDKNCELAPEHIKQIAQAYKDLADIERHLDDDGEPVGIAARVFDNADFGYYKVNIERPDRRRAGFSAERIAPLRFDRTMRQVMEWLWEEHREQVYEKDFVKGQKDAITRWCEEQGISLNAARQRRLADVRHWHKFRELHNAAQQLMELVGSEETADFNEFCRQVAKTARQHDIRLTAGQRNAILNAVSWYDESAEKVIKKRQKLSAETLQDLADHHGCKPDELADFGWYAQPDGSYITYEPCSDLRDSESVPLKDCIHRYFQAEVQPHVPDAWINLGSVRIGYEISFNKYFYRHKPLRSLEEVTRDILALEKQADGLIADILGVEVVSELESVE